MFYKFSSALLFAVLTCGQIASAEISQEGKCPVATPPKQFDWRSLKGVWIEYARYENDFEASMDCVYQIYSNISHNIFDIQFTALRMSHQPFYFYGTGKILQPAIFFFTGESAPNQTYIILGAEFKSWMVIYSCDQAGEYRKERAWILTRERVPNEKAVGNAKNLLVKNGVSLKYLLYTRQTDCTW